MELFPSKPEAPRVVITIGMAIPNYSRCEMHDELYTMGNSQYGQMTAGPYCYIGPQGISMSGIVYVSSGIGDMRSGQRNVGVISVAVEIDAAVVKKRHEQDWVDEVTSDLDACVARIRHARRERSLRLPPTAR